MRKRMIGRTHQQHFLPDEPWLDIERLADVEISSEDAAHPIPPELLPPSGR